MTRFKNSGDIKKQKQTKQTKTNSTKQITFHIYDYKLNFTLHSGLKILPFVYRC